MGFTRSSKDLKIIQKLSDYPNMEDGLSSEKLKEKFDEGAEAVQEDLNKLINELEEMGATNIGAQQLSGDDTSANNVQAKLLYILGQIQNTVLSQIPDGTITRVKLSNDYANILAEKDGTLQMGLNAELINGNTDVEMYRSMVKIGTYTGSSTESQIIEVGFKPSAVIIQSTRKNYEWDSGTFSLDNEGIISSEGFTISYENNTNIYTSENVLTDTGFIVNKPKKDNKTIDTCGLNILNQKYNFIAFR